MNRTPINPWQWSLNVGYNQGEVIDGATRTLTISGQTAVDANGAPQHAGDMRAQMVLALDNLQAVLEQAGMDASNITRLGIYVTDMAQALASFDVMGARFGPLGVTPPTTLLGVAALAVAGKI